MRYAKSQFCKLFTWITFLNKVLRNFAPFWHPAVKCRLPCAEDGLPVCPSLRPLLPLWPLLPSVGFGSASGGAFCCEGWAFGPSVPLSYCAAKGLFGCWPIGKGWSPHWAAFLDDGPPFQILHDLPEKYLNFKLMYNDLFIPPNSLIFYLLWFRISS